MNLTVDSSLFGSALALVSSVAKTRTTLPLLHCARLATDGTTLHLTATDLDCCFSKSIPVKCDSPLTCLVPFRLAKEWLDGAGKGQLTITADGRQTTLAIGSSKLKLFTEDASGFPAWPTGEETEIASADLKPVHDVMLASPESDARPELFSVPIEADGGGMVSFAGNGLFMAVRRFEGKCSSNRVIRLLPTLVTRIASLGHCSISEMDNFYVFRGADFTFLAKKLTSAGIDWRRTLNGWTFPTKVVLMREDLLSAVASCHVLRGMERMVRVFFIQKEDGIQLSAKTATGEFTQFISTRTEGDFGQVVLPADNILATLRSLDDEMITLEINPLIVTKLSTANSDYYFAAFREK